MNSTYPHKKCSALLGTSKYKCETHKILMYTASVGKIKWQSWGVKQLALSYITIGLKMGRDFGK